MINSTAQVLLLSLWNVLRLYTPSTKTTGIVVEKLGRTGEVAETKTRNFLTCFSQVRFNSARVALTYYSCMCFPLKNWRKIEKQEQMCNWINKIKAQKQLSQNIITFLFLFSYAIARNHRQCQQHFGVVDARSATHVS
jgi:hypothetical protein